MAIFFSSFKKKVSAGYPPRPLAGSDDIAISSILEEGDVVIIQPATNTPPSSKTNADTLLNKSSAPVARTADASAISGSDAAASIASQGTVCLREVPDDNSCLFRCVNALLGEVNRTPTYLRQIIANVIMSNPHLYSEVVLGKSNADYAAWILSDHAWGGAIELAILAEHFKVQFAAFDVHTMRLDRYAQDRSFPTVAFLIYDGIHYNYAALSLTGASIDADITQFEANDRYVLAKVREIAQKLNDSRNYTDTASFTLKCKRCGAQFKGEKQALEHAKGTGHSQFDEN